MSDSLGTDPLLFVSVGDEVPVVLVLVVLLTFVVVVVDTFFVADWYVRILMFNKSLLHKIRSPSR